MSNGTAGKDKTQTCVIAALMAPFVLVINSVAQGLTTCVLWRWFVVPQFHLAPLSVPVALGLGILVGMYSNTAPDTEEERRQSTVERLIGAVIKCLVKCGFALLFGRIYLAFT